MAIQARGTGSNMDNNAASSSIRADEQADAGDGVTLVSNTKNSDRRTSNSNSNSNSSEKVSDNDKVGDGVNSFKPSPRFWAILITCAVIGLLSALENTVVTTALPYIVAEFDMGENYIWITNIFFLTGYVPGEPCCTNYPKRACPWRWRMLLTFAYMS